ncbi:MAG: universal stress protein [Pseudomonadales bacterium]
MQIRSILTVLDKPKHKQTAFEAAQQLQEQTGANLDLVAFRFNSLYDHDGALDKEQRRQLRHKVVADSRAWMKELAADSTVPEKTKMRTIWTSDIADWLADEVIERPVDLVVKSIHGSKTFTYTPTDWQILRTCNVPVLLKSTQRRRKPGNVVLVGLDFTRADAKRRKLNQKAMDAAKCMAALTGAKVHGVFALEISEVLRDLDIIDKKVTRKSILGRVMPDVEQFLAANDLPKSRMHFPVGKAGRVINSLAHDLNADLLVLGTGIHRVRQAIGLGSTAERVLPRAYRDVLVVHP